MPVKRDIFTIAGKKIKPQVFLANPNNGESEKNREQSKLKFQFILFLNPPSKAVCL
jgi:hypothetical protein